MLHAPQVAALVNNEHAEDDDRELPGKQERIRREGSQSQHQLASLDNDQAAFDQRTGKAAFVLMPSQPPENHDVPMSYQARTASPTNWSVPLAWAARLVIFPVVVSSLTRRTAEPRPCRDCAVPMLYLSSR